MSTTEVAVTLAGLAAIVWINWYFFIAGRAAVAGTEEGGVQVRADEKGGGASIAERGE